MSKKHAEPAEEMVPKSQLEAANTALFQTQEAAKDLAARLAAAEEVAKERANLLLEAAAELEHLQKKSKEAEAGVCANCGHAARVPVSDAPTFEPPPAA